MTWYFSKEIRMERKRQKLLRKQDKKKRIGAIKHHILQLRKGQKTGSIIYLKQTLPFFARFKFWFLKDKAILVFMEMANGEFSIFLAYPENESFIFKEKEYVVDSESKFYVQSLSSFCYFYHQNITLPLKISTPVDEIKKITEQEREVHASINPDTLRRFTKSKFIQMVIEGADIQNEIAFIKIMVAVNALIGLAAVLLAFR